MGQQIQFLACAHQFSYERDLIKHHKSVHMSQRFQCPECEHMATKKGNRVRHQHMYAWEKHYSEQNDK